MARVATLSWAVLAVSLVSAPARAQESDPENLLFYSNGTGSPFRWNFAEDRRGEDPEGGGIDGGGPVFPSCGTLVSGEDGGFAYFGYMSILGARGEDETVCSPDWDLAFGDRGFIMGAYNPWEAEVEVTRQIYVPADADFTRWADRIENTSDADQDLQISFQGSLGWERDIAVYDSSSGDAIVDAEEDNWVVVDDADEDGGMPAMAVVWQSEDAETKAEAIEVYDWGDFYLGFTVTIPARSTRTMLLFAVQASSRDEAAALAEELSQLGSAGADELDEDIDGLINFVPSEPGSPRVRMNGPHAVPEGGDLVVHATAEDAEGDNMTYEWDLDDDGSYDDLQGTLDAPLSALNVDGPAGLRIGLRVTDTTAHVVERHTTVSVQNTAPVVSSTPGTAAATGQPYVYQIVATDFVLDTIHYRIDEGPPGMTVRSDGLVEWTPAADGRGPDVPVVVEVEDDDGDSVDHAWTIHLTGAPFVQPGGPYHVVEGGEVVLAPVVSDPEGDPVTFAWDLDSDHGYDDSVEPIVTWSAAGIDGPAEGFEVGLRVSDDTWEVSFMIPVDVRNVGPVFLSVPPPDAIVDREWVYQPEISDAGGDNFTIEPDEDEIPPGMVLDDTGTLRWTPNAGHLVEGTYEFTLTAEDEDNSRTRQEIVINVRENVAPPYPPLSYPSGEEKVRILRPRIILENVDDPDGDPLEYFIQVDRDICFCSPDLMESGPLAEGELVTQWQLPAELDPEAGLTPGLFYVRRWTSDGLATSEKKDSLFQVDLSAEPEPEPPNDDSDDGCGCRAAGAPSGAAGSALPLLGTALAGLFLARRRR